MKRRTQIVALGVMAVALGLGWPLPISGQQPVAPPFPPTSSSSISSPSATQRPEGIDALAALNAVFRETYARTRTIELEKAGPLILLDGDQLVLFRGKERRAADVIPKLYHDLKAVSHLTLGVFVTLLPIAERGDAAGGVPTSEEMGLISRLRRAAQDARGDLEGRDFSPEQIVRQQRILDASIEFLGTQLQQRRVKGDELQAFTRRMAPDVLANAYDAGRAQIDATNAQVQAWRRNLRPGEWEKMRIVVVGGQMPRKGNISLQYFAKLLGEPGEGKRIIYAEALFEEERALRLAGTHTLDRKVALAFFDDSERMHRDLLSDAAEKYLRDFKFD